MIITSDTNIWESLLSIIIIIIIYFFINICYIELVHKYIWDKIYNEYVNLPKNCPWYLWIKENCFIDIDKLHTTSFNIFILKSINYDILLILIPFLFIKFFNKK